MHAIQYRWRIYQIDSEGRLKVPVNVYWGMDTDIFDSGYDTEEQAIEDIRLKAEEGVFDSEVIIIKTCRAINVEMPWRKE